MIRTDLALLAEGVGCKIINMQDEDGFDEQTDEDFYDVLEDAERIQGEGQDDEATTTPAD